MTNSKRSSWQDIHQEILRRIRTRQWSPGDWIPNEEDLALEFGCARATVNRALREAAEAGLLDRKRKAGTRVTPQPAHKAVFRIPILRQEIQDLGGEHSYRLVSRSYGTPTLPVAKKMGVSREAELLRLQSLHFADTKPFVFEDRWVNPDVVSGLDEADFRVENANEWLLAHAAFTHGEVVFSAASASKREAKALEIEVGAAVFVAERTTWVESKCVTHVRLVYAPGYQVQMVG